MNAKLKRGLWSIPVAAIFVLTMGADESGCEETNTDPAPDSDSSQEYKDGSKVPVDDNVYLITGEVIGEVNSVTRQVAPAEGSLSGPSCFGTSGCYGGTTGSFTGPIEKGKGFVRVRVQSSEPATELAPEGDVAIIKTSDTKVSALLAGDIISY